MTIYPAIDLKGGKCVRLVQGDMDKATVYGEDPAAVAKSFEQKGAKWLHIVDLDGAFAGGPVNIEAVIAINRSVEIPLQLGGGLRNMEQLNRAFHEIGVARAIIGTAALEDFGFLEEAIAKYGDCIAVGIDAKDGMVAVRGWAKTSSVSVSELALRVKEAGVRTVIYTDISRDGMLSGPNFDSTEKLIRETGLQIIVSGGVSETGHASRAREIGAAGVIIGKALYTGAVRLEDAITAGGKQC